MNLQKILKFIPDAEAARGRSKDLSTKVGAVVMDDDYNVRVSGYNGFPRGVNDVQDYRFERPRKYFYTAHAEENCIAQAARIGVSLRGCTLLLTSLHPCSSCARMIIQAGIVRVVAPRVPANSRWDESAEVAFEMFNESGIELEFYE